MSNKNKWSPAPWTSNGMSSVSSANGECLAVLVNGQVHRKDKEEDYATAHLIAAAPEMYEMLEDIYETMRSEYGYDWNGVDKLLAKARGETD